MSVDLPPAVNQRIEAFEAALSLGGNKPAGELFTGVDLGTAYTVTAVVDSSGNPVAGMLTHSGRAVRDGLVLDYVGAVETVRRQADALRRAGYNIRKAAAAYPPGTQGGNSEAFRNVLLAADLSVDLLIDEPTAASRVLEIDDGAVVDIGGGTTGISVIQDGDVVYTADEATGGIHVDLVIAGRFGISTEDAVKMKHDPERQPDLFHVVRPVFEKMAAIVRKHLDRYPVNAIYLVGGTGCFPGIETVMARETGIQTIRPDNPFLVTPLGIALSCRLFHHRTQSMETGS